MTVNREVLHKIGYCYVSLGMNAEHSGIFRKERSNFPLLFEVETTHSQIKDPYMLAKKVYDIGRKWLEIES